MTDERTALTRVETSDMALPEHPQHQIDRPRPDRIPEPRVRQTADVDALQTAFAEAWMEFPIIPKNRTARIEKGPVRYEYKYADLSDVKRLVDPVLKNHGLAFMCIPSGGRLIGRLIHAESGQWLEGDLAIVPPDTRGGCQALGSALTYTRRYLTSNMLNLSLEEGEDDDGAGAHPDTSPRHRQQDSEPPPADTARDLMARAEGASREEIPALMKRAMRLPLTFRGDPVCALVARLYHFAPNVEAVRAPSVAKYARDCGCSDDFIREQEEKRIAELQAQGTGTASRDPRIDAFLAAIREAPTPEAAARALAQARETGDRDDFELAFAERIAAAADAAADEAQLIALEGLLKQARLRAQSAHLALASGAIETARRDLASGE